MAGPGVSSSWGRRGSPPWRKVEWTPGCTEKDHTP